VAAELGRATIYGYFPSLDALVTAMAQEALRELSGQVTRAQGRAEELDAPVRFSQANPAAFALLFAPTGARPLFSGPEITHLRDEAQQMIRKWREPGPLLEPPPPAGE
jgi:AcrR family transcriptional regulator